MRALTDADLQATDLPAAPADDVVQRLCVTIGESTLAGGVWRLYGQRWPLGGFVEWNTTGPWRKCWEPSLAVGLRSFGEDVFGNQLVLLDGKDEVLLWDHETAATYDLLLPPFHLLRVVSTHGVSWIDSYTDQILAVADAAPNLDRDSHLHWITPLFLGGEATQENTSVEDRCSHLEFHATLWRSLEGLPPGTELRLQ